MNKYLLLSGDNEPNIAVIQCDKNCKFEKGQVETALAQHFDTDIDITEITTVSRHPFKYVVKYSYDNFGEKNNEIVTLDETWLY